MDGDWWIGARCQPSKASINDIASFLKVAAIPWDEGISAVGRRPLMSPFWAFLFVCFLLLTHICPSQTYLPFYLCYFILFKIVQKEEILRSSMSHLDLSLPRPESLWVCCPPSCAASANILICIDALIKVGLPPEPANQKLERTSALNLGLPKNIVELLNSHWCEHDQGQSVFLQPFDAALHPTHILPCLSSNLGWWHFKAVGGGGGIQVNSQCVL